MTGSASDELLDRLKAHYASQDCDGLFLSAVTYDGLRLPVRELVESLDEGSRPRFVVVDGAQALNHAPLGLAAEYCDLLLAGCHKWLRAYQPLGLAFCCRQSSERLVTTVCDELLDRGELDDPLLRFLTQLESSRPERYGETVNLVPVFTAAAAVRRMLSSRRSKQAEFASQVSNVDDVAARQTSGGWRPLQPCAAARSGILLLEAKSVQTKAAQIDVLRERFLRAGVALTAYDGGLLRASLPDRPLAPAEVKRLFSALRRCA